MILLYSQIMCKDSIFFVYLQPKVEKKSFFYIFLVNSKQFVLFRYITRENHPFIWMIFSCGPTWA